MPLPNRLTNPGKQLRSHYYGGESDTIREIPPEFRAALDLTVLEIPLPWDQEIIPLSDTVLASKGEQKVTAEWVRRTTFKPPGWVTLNEFFTNKNKQVVNRARTFKTVGDPTTSPSAFTDVKTQNLGNLHFIEDVENAGFVFPNETCTTEVADLVPEKFRALLPMYEHREVFTGIITCPPVLAGTEFYRSETQEDVFNMSRTTKSRTPIGGYPVQFTEYKMTPEQQVETITETLSDSAQPFVPTGLWVEGTEEAIGDGRTILRVGTVPYVFNKKIRGKSILDLIPPALRAAVPMYKSEDIIPGIVVDPPVLGGGELSHTETQITVFNKKVETENLGPITGATLLNKELTDKFGGGVLDQFLTLSNVAATIDQGLLVLESRVIDLGNGFFVKDTKQLEGAAWPILSARLWDDNMRLEYDVLEQVVAAGTPEDANPGVFGWISEVKPIDKWRSKKTNISKVAPLYTDFASALISYESKPYRFPGLIYFSGFGYYVRHADAALCKHKIRTWWVNSGTTPIISEDDIIMDDVVINDLSLRGLTYSGPALHDDLQIGVLHYPATTPSYTQYALGTPTGGSTLVNTASLYAPGAGGYAIGDVVNINSAGGNMSITVTYVYDVPGGATGLIGGWTNNTGGTYLPGQYNFIAGSGGSGSGSIWNVFAAEVPNYTPGTQWIGTWRIVASSVKPEKEKDVWKCQTEEVIMR